MAIVVCFALVVGYQFPAAKALKKAVHFVLFFMLFPMMITVTVEGVAL